MCFSVHVSGNLCGVCIHFSISSQQYKTVIVMCCEFLGRGVTGCGVSMGSLCAIVNSFNVEGCNYLD